MSRPLRIALVGDYREDVIAHRAIPVAIELAATDLEVDATAVWAPTTQLNDDWVYEAEGLIGGADGIWCVPASPYESMSGALRAIKHARLNSVPFMGTCGGFQHAVLEFARSVLGWSDAAHAETDPDAERPIIVPLECALVEQSGDIYLTPGTRLADAYGTDTAEEKYRCRYGMAPGVRHAMEAVGLVVSAEDEEGDVRGIELPSHPFYVATLFQHERVALEGTCPPPVRAFLKAIAQQAA